MTIWSSAQAAQFAANAGFTGNSLKVILGIAQAESGLNDQAHHVNSDGSVDRGILQINSVAHAEVKDACAYDPQCAFNAGYTISNHGVDFAAWTTYQSGAYLRYTSATPVVQSLTPFPGGTPWYEDAFGNLFGQGDPGIGGEHGTDLETPPDTPITFLLPGVITDISSPVWGKQVTWKLDNPWHGIPYAYQIHLDAVNPALSVGDHVNAGDLMGWSGGENSLQQMQNATNPTGTHFIDSSYMSSGPHTEFGFSYGPVYGSGTGFADIGLHPELNPIQFLDSVRSGQYPEPQGYSTPLGGGNMINITQNTQPSMWSGVPLALTGANDAFLGLSENIHQSLQHAPGFYGIALGLDEAETFTGLYNAFSGDPNPGDWPGDAMMSVMGTVTGNLIPLVVRSMLILIGFVIVVAAVMQAAKPLYMDVAAVSKVAIGAGA